MEFLSQYDTSISYIPGNRNCIMDALSCCPHTTLETVASLFDNSSKTFHKTTLELDTNLLNAIKDRYLSDPFISKLTSASTGINIINKKNGFWFINDQLVIPNIKHVHESLFYLAHDTMAHFRSERCLGSLRDSLYWPHMCQDLKDAYIPSSPDCQRNKSKTIKPVRPLHSLPIHDAWCNSVAIDFISPLSVNNRFDTIMAFTDHLRSDVQIIPTTSTLTAKELADTFFDRWYCENRLPLDILLDQDELFMSYFWKRLHTLTSIKLKMSTAYHPETNGSSEQTNKTIIQCICFAVECDQLDWVKTLPKIRFDIMNTVNCSTGFTPFQLWFSRSPHILPPLIPSEQLTSTDKFITVLTFCWMKYM